MSSLIRHLVQRPSGCWVHPSKDRLFGEKLTRLDAYRFSPPAQKPASVPGGSGAGLAGNPVDDQPGYLSTPYSHSDHAEACQEASKRGVTLEAWVQIKASGSACCAAILSPWTDGNGRDWWKLRGVEPFSFIGSYPVGSVRQCSGLDGRCVCAGEVSRQFV